MSETFQPTPPEDEALPVGTILIAAGVAVVIFTVAILIAWWMSLAAAPARVPTPAAEIGLVFQRPFALEKTAQQLKLEHQRRLAGYGWADRERQLVHIPIKAAVEQLVAGPQKEAAR